VPKLLNISFTLLKIEKMNSEENNFTISDTDSVSKIFITDRNSTTWQEITLGIILALAIYFLYKRFTQKDDDCNSGSCCDN